MINDSAKSQGGGKPRTSEKRGFKVSAPMWIVGGALLALGLFNAVLLVRPLTLGAPQHTPVHVFPQGHPPVLTSYDLVQVDIVTFSLRQPFYTPAEIDSLREGDILHITAEGEGIWRKVPDRKQPVFSQAFRVRPLGIMAQVVPKKADVPIDISRVLTPKQIPAGYNRNEYPHQDALQGCLIGAVGIVRYDDDGMMVRLGDHFAVGGERWLRIDGLASKDTQLLFALNIRWKEVAWERNEGLYHIRTQLYRPRGTDHRRREGS